MKPVKCYNGCPEWREGHHKFSCRFSRMDCGSTEPHRGHQVQNPEGVFYTCRGTEHNHMTRDIKTDGSCPACVLYHRS